MVSSRHLSALLWIAIAGSSIARAEANLEDNINDEESAVQSLSGNHPKGFKLPKNWRHGANFVKQSPFTQKAAIPSSYDWRSQPGGITGVKDQGSCGSCWAFSTVATFADTILIKDRLSKNLSQQYLVSCDSHGWNCDGGFWAFDMFEQTGAVYGSDMPYTGTNGSCPATVPHHEKIANWAYVGGPDAGIPNADDLKRTIMEFGPVSVAVNATDAMQFYFGGVFSTCVPTTEDDINHAVNIVGWNDAGGYWIVRNSWGRSWGESGYIRMKYGCNGIGWAASYINYKPTCSPQPVAQAGADHKITAGQSAQIGSDSLRGLNFEWSPTTGLDDPSSPTPVATPEESTLYTVTVKNECGIAASQVQIEVEE